jgi:hypothetical protein
MIAAPPALAQSLAAIHHWLTEAIAADNADLTRSLSLLLADATYAAADAAQTQKAAASTQKAA